MLRAQCDDREALEQLLRQVQPPLHGYLCGLVGPADADDVLQEVLVLVFRKLQALAMPELFRPWVFRIATRVGIRHLKREKRWLANRSEESFLEDFPALEMQAPGGLLQQLENNIPAASRTVLLLHFQQEMTLAEVAAILDLPIGTVKSRLAYGLSVLRKQLGSGRKL